MNSREAIVEVALGLFGKRGIRATSLRQVARTAGVSPALIVHYFGGKRGLVAAADGAALVAFRTAYESGDPETGGDVLRQRLLQTARVIREHPDVCAYLGRALVEQTPGTTELFKLTIKGGRNEIASLAERGAVREDADLLWAALQHFLLIWAPLSFMPLLEEVLGGPLLDEENLERWVAANLRLLEGGLHR